MKILKQSLLCVLVLGGLQACSFRSTQLDLIMTAFNGTEDLVPFDELAWTLNWAGNDVSLIPAFPAGMSLTDFMNRDGTVIVSFDGWQVVRADGVLPDELNIAIVETETGLEYSSEAGLITTHICAEFASILEGQTTVWSQNCDSAGGSYTNEIRVNATGSITLLRFLIHPEYPMLTLTPNNLIF
ncbi:MAG: hypothetical protein COA71_02280 [SAR86 cluster bacterium]|uniref:Uncharacterized protein n=1 Tax=SAR86 cluster bacterium TaxID=2030880 RepID=A0A2A5CJX7_9GAMM|nr:MAG: hypothetical protein COA71_02280 [SAR86 cluster bacterium]